MKRHLLAALLLVSLSPCLPVSADTATDLQAALPPEQWTQVNALLIEQRTALNAALETILAAVQAEKTAAQAERDAAVAALAAKQDRITAVLTKFITAEAASGQGPKFQLLMALKAEADKPAKQVEAESLAAQIAADQAALQAKQAKLAELGQ